MTVPSVEPESTTVFAFRLCVLPVGFSQPMTGHGSFPKYVELLSGQLWPGDSPLV